MYSILSRSQSRIGLWSLLLTLAALTGQAHAAVWTVDSTSADPALSACTSAPADCSFPGAVSRLNFVGDSIVFTVNESLASEVFIRRDLVIEAAGARLPRLVITTNGVGWATVTVRNARWENHDSAGASGGALRITRSQIVTIEDSVFQNNRTSNQGGAIFNEGELVVRRTRFQGNFSLGGAAAIHSTSLGSLLVTDSTFRANGVLDPTGPGRQLGRLGAIAAQRSLDVRGSLFHDNESRFASAIWSDTDTRIYNSTFTNNKSFESPEGGTVFLAGNTRIANCTIVGNSGIATGGLWVQSSTSDTQVVNTILANNLGQSPEVFGRIYTYGNNLIRDRGTAVIDVRPGNTNIPSVDPGLAPLGNNGGPTLTMQPLPNSPVINAGSECVLFANGCDVFPHLALTVDQRGAGFARSRAGAMDIGALELGVVVVSNAQDSGAGSLRQAITDALPGDLISFARPLFDQPQTIALASTLVVNKPLSILGPGSNLLTLDAGNQRRHLTVEAPATLTLSGMRFTRGNPGTNADGGAILVNQGTLNANEIVIDDSTGNAGGCIYNNGTLELSRARLSGCRANFSAGLFNAAGRTATLRDSRIENNIATGPGGAIGNPAGATLVLDRVSLSGNRGTIGGALNSYGTATLTNTTFSGNTGDNGGAMYLGGTGTTSLTHATVTLNTAQLNGGVAAEFDAIVNLRSTLIAGNTRTVDQAPDAGGNFTSFGHNLIGDPFATVFRPSSPSLVGNILGAQARLAALADNGGHSLTHAPLHNSPIIDAGGLGSPFDARRQLRPVDFTNLVNASGGNGSDIGAHELQVATPVNVVATPVATGLSVRFDGGANGGPGISGYTATCGARSATGTASPIVVTGLAIGVQVTCTVTASSGALTGIPSAPSASVAPATVPGAPAIGTPIAGDARVDVVFTAPANNGGSPITGYTATCGGRSQSGSASPIRVTGLSNGVAVTCSVVATNIVGSGPASATSPPVTPVAAVSITSAPPPGGSFRQPYIHTVVANATPPASFALASGSLPPGLALNPVSGEISGLPTAVGTFAAVLRASNGQGEATQAFSITIAPTIPDPPVIGTLIAGDGRIEVYFTPPANDGGSPITVYSALCAFAGSGAASPIIMNATNGVPQRCRVFAVNAVGAGAASEFSNEVTPQAQASLTLSGGVGEAIAGLPVTYTATVAPASATGTVSFDTGPSADACTAVALVNSGASCTTRFRAAGTFTIRASYSGDAAHTAASGQLASGQVVVAPTITIAPALSGGAVGSSYGPVSLSAVGGLAPHTFAITQGALPAGLTLSAAGILSGTPTTPGSRSFTVTATDANQFSGTRDYTLSIAGVPGAPTGVVATRGNAQVSVAFVAPTDTGGSAITGYTATCGSRSQAGVASPITVTGLTNGVAVTCTVIATNAIGNSAASAPSASVTPATVPGAPTGVVGTRGNAQVSVAFVAPTENGGSAITGYTATCGSQSQSGTASPTNVTGLTNGVAVTCTVIATNAIGNSAASAPSASVTPATVPGAPTGVTAISGNGSATIAFAAPGSDGGASVSGYTARCLPGTAAVSGAASPLTVTGLVNGTVYTCRVTASNAMGEGPESAPVTVVPGAQPIADVIVSASNGTGFVTGGVPTVYTIRVRNSGPSGVANVRVRSVLDADFTAASWTCSGEGGGLCAGSGSGTTLDQRVDLPVGGSVTFLLSATVAALPETPVSIVVSAEVPAPFEDPNLQSNVATDGPDLRGLFRNGLE